MVVRLRIQPRSSRKGVIGRHGDRIRFAVHAPPSEGAANRALLRELAKALGVSMSCLSILAGERSREKDVLVEAELSEREILDRLGVPVES